MAIRKYKPTTPGRRGSSVADFAEITRSTPEKSLLRPLSKTGGRNNQGRITTRHIGGGHKRQYRVIDFRRNDKDGIDAKVAHIEYDPNRTARIALLHYADGEKRYIIAPNKLSQGDVVESGAGRRHQAGQQPAAAQHPDRYRDPRDRAPPRRRREDGPFGGRLGASRRQGRPLRPAASPLGRDPQRRRALPRDRSARSATPSSRTSTGARPAATAGRASARPSAVSR